MEPPPALTATQQQAWHDCMEQKRQQHPIALGPIALSTIAKKQRDYDNCVALAKATLATATSQSTAHP
jgi:hypothetical protein